MNHPLRFLRTKSLLLPLAVILLLSACSPKIVYNTSTVVPTAEGNVKVKKDKNGNFMVSTEIINLAPPQKLPNPQNLYIVWADTPEGTKNLGQIKTAKGLLGNALKGSLATTTTSKPTRIFITAENDVNVTYPGNYVVLTTNNF
jgi:hypothetical protein